MTQTSAINTRKAQRASVQWLALLVHHLGECFGNVLVCFGDVCPAEQGGCRYCAGLDAVCFLEEVVVYLLCDYRVLPVGGKRLKFCSRLYMYF